MSDATDRLAADLAMELGPAVINMVNEKVAQKLGSIFDEPCFVIVCPKCKTVAKLEDAIDRDSGCGSDPCHSISVICPHCKLEATL